MNTRLTPGGYTAGKWTAPTAWVTRAFGEHGYAIASVGYRQQPQASMAEMLSDCVAAATWCRSHLPALVGADADAWVVGGSSGGASLACLVAHASPAPRVLVDVYGAPNAADDYHHNPYRKVAVEPYFVADEDELADALSDRDPRNAVTQSPWAYEIPPAVSLDECRAALGVPDFKPAREHFARNDLWSYVAKHRLLMPTVFRREVFATERDYWSHVTAHSSYHLLDGKTTFPATFIMHGTADTDVRIQQSWEFADKIRRLGVPVGESYPEGKGHMFDFDLIVSWSERCGTDARRRPTRGGTRTSRRVSTLWMRTLAAADNVRRRAPLTIGSGRRRETMNLDTALTALSTHHHAPYRHTMYPGCLAPLMHSSAVRTRHRFCVEMSVQMPTVSPPTTQSRFQAGRVDCHEAAICSLCPL